MSKIIWKKIFYTFILGSRDHLKCLSGLPIRHKMKTEKPFKVLGFVQTFSCSYGDQFQIHHVVQDHLVKTFVILHLEVQNVTVQKVTSYKMMQLGVLI